MKLGLLTAAFPDLTLDGGRRLGGGARLRDARGRLLARRRAEQRRYAGVSHIDVETSTPTRARDPRPTRRSAISSLAYYPNNLHPDDAAREEVNGHLRKVIDAAQALGVGIVGTFVGNDKDRPLPENLERFRRIWPELVNYAGERGRADRDRELPDDLQLRRVARRQQPRLVARDLGRDVHRDPRRELRPQPRPLPPRLAADRLHARSGTTSATGSSTPTRRISRSAARGCTATAPSRAASAGRCRGCRGSARSTGRGSSPRCTRSATTTSCRSSTRTGTSSRRRSSSSAASCSRTTH